MQWQICRYPWRHPPVILEMLGPHLLLWHTGGTSLIVVMHACNACCTIRGLRQHACTQAMFWCLKAIWKNSRASGFQELVLSPRCLLECVY